MTLWRLATGDVAGALPAAGAGAGAVHHPGRAGGDAVVGGRRFRVGDPDPAGARRRLVVDGPAGWR